MSALLLDTTVLVAVERNGFDLDRLIADDDDVALAAITVAELGVGAELATGKRRSQRRAFIDALVRDFPVIGYDTTVANAHTVLLVAARRTGRPRGAHDLIIAATARATGRIIVTHDRTGFADLPGVGVRSPD